MAVINLPQQNIDVPTRTGGRNVNRSGEIAEAGARAGLADTVGKSLVALTGMGINLWKEHEARTAQKDFDAGKLSYIKAMDEQAALLAQTPGVPTTDDPYPNATALEKRHKEELQRISGLKNSRVKDALSLYAQQEFKGRFQKEKMKDIESGRKATFDNYIEDFQYFMQTGDLEKCTDTISKMVGFGLVDKKAADDLLDGAYQYKQTEALMAKAVSLSEEDGAKLIDAAISYKGHDGKDLAYSPEQKEQMMKSFTDRWKAIDAEKAEQKKQSWFQAGNEYLKTFVSIQNNPATLAKFRDSVLNDPRSADFQGHSGLREKYVKMVNDRIEDMQKGGSKVVEKDDPETLGNLMNLFKDQYVANPLVEAEALDAYSKGKITESTYKFLISDNYRSEASEFKQAVDQIDGYFKIKLADKKLSEEKKLKLMELRDSAINEYTRRTTSKDWLSYDPDRRKELSRKLGRNIIDSYSNELLIDNLEGKSNVFRMENFVASPYANKNNENKDIQRKIQAGAWADTETTKIVTTQHQDGLVDMASRTIGSSPAIIYRKNEKELQQIGMTEGDVILAYKAEYPNTTDENLLNRVNKYMFKNKNGQTFNLYKWTVDDNNVWNLNAYDAADAMWKPVEEVPYLDKQKYWKAPPPPKITPTQAVEQKNEDIWTKRQQWNQGKE